MKLYLVIFITVFLAELGDKTQLATLLFATDEQASKFMVFLMESLALIVSTGLAVLLGAGAAGPGGAGVVVPVVAAAGVAAAGFVALAALAVAGVAGAGVVRGLAAAGFAPTGVAAE